MTRIIPVSLIALALRGAEDYVARWEAIGFSGWVSKWEIAFYCCVTPDRAHECLEVLYAKGKLQRQDRIVFGGIRSGYEYHPLKEVKNAKSTK